MATIVTDETGEPVGSAFDPESAAEVARETRELKKNNLRNVFGTGAGRLALAAVVLVFLVLFAFGAYRIFKKPAPQQAVDSGANASGAVLDVPQMQADGMAANSEDAKMRKQTIAKQAAEAARSGTGYIAPPVLQSANPEDAFPAPVKAPTPTEEQQRQAAQAAAQPLVEVENPAMSQRAQRIADLRPLRDQIVKDQALPQILVALGRDREGRAVQPFSTQTYALPDRTPKAAQLASSGGLSAQAQPTGALAAGQKGERIIQAGDGYYCETDYAINTDAPRKDLIVTCAQGILNGAKMLGKYEEPKEGVGEAGVAGLLSLLSLPGKASIPVQAVVIDDANGASYLADDVNHHGVLKYGGLFVASVLRGFGKAASIVTGTTSSVSNGGFSTTTTTTDPITGNRQVKIAAGEVGTTFADAIQKNSDQLRTTIKVNERKGVRVVFLADVYEEKK